MKAAAKTAAKAKPQGRLLTAVKKLATAAVAAGVSAALAPKKKPNLDRPRKTVADIHGIPSSLDLDRTRLVGQVRPRRNEGQALEEHQRRPGHHGG